MTMDFFSQLYSYARTRIEQTTHIQTLLQEEKQQFKHQWSEYMPSIYGVWSDKMKLQRPYKDSPKTSLTTGRLLCLLLLLHISLTVKVKIFTKLQRPSPSMRAIAIKTCKQHNGSEHHFWSKFTYMRDDDQKIPI